MTRFSQIDKDEDEDENILRKKFLYLLLDSDTNVGNFFKKTIESAPDKDKLDAYKDAYILSLSIINQLHVKKLNEKLVAHYREKTISQKLLFGKSKFRLNAVNYSNDPTEGKTLLDYFYGEEKYTSKGKAEYGAFAGCFSFNYNSLNQFRLYGKEKGKEGTGLSLVFNRSFFSEEVIYPTELIKKEDKGLREEKYALFRCIYVDSLTQRVETVGQKEEYLFYREEKEKAEENYTGYKEDITKIIEKVSEEMEKLREKVQELTPKVVDQLLINLRYLTKHIAFKEEQECRIVKIYNLKDSDSDIKTNEEFSQMYVKYAPNVSKHIEKVYFGPKADGMELFQDILTHKGLNITCEKSKNILA